MIAAASQQRDDVKAMAIDEDSGDGIRCPYCGTVDDCAHLVAAIDRTFGEVLGGHFFDHSKAFSDTIERTFLEALRSGKKRASPKSDLDLAELWEGAAGEYANPDDGVWLDSLVLTRFERSLLMETDALEPIGDPVTPDTFPGQSSALALFYSENPTATVEQVFALLEDRLDHLFPSPRTARAKVRPNKRSRKR